MVYRAQSRDNEVLRMVAVLAYDTFGELSQEKQSKLCAGGRRGRRRRLTIMAVTGMFLPGRIGRQASYRATDAVHGAPEFADIPVGFTTYGNVEDVKRRRKVDLKHGGVAMLAAMGYIINASQASYRATVSVHGALGFADIPVGVATDGNVEDLEHCRKVELKHGMAEVLATMCYITPKITGRRPGYLSPAVEVKFANRCAHGVHHLAVLQVIAMLAMSGRC